MASEYPFRRIVGVEILAELHEIALQNIARLSERGAEMFRDRVATPAMPAV